MNAVAYSLWHEASHLESGADDDALLVSFNGKERICGWIGTELHDVPRPILFEADFKNTRYTDYPCNDVNWPIMSPHMLDVLCELGDFPHRLIPVRFVDRRARGLARSLPDGSLRPEAVDDRFSSVQLTEYLDVVDWEHSVFEKSQIGAAVFWDFDKLVLLEPPGGLPPLFRLSSDMSLLLVSADARRALEAAGIRGIRFLSLPGARRVEAGA